MRINRKDIMVAAMALATIWATPVQAAGRSIVGTWAPDPAACAPVAGMIAVGPTDIRGDELACRSTDVARRGDVVTWHGQCGQPEPARPATVVAKLAGENLRVTINGNDAGAYRRCPVVPTAAPELKATGPWPGDRWRADVETVKYGHVLHATLIGTGAKTSQGDGVEVTCTDKDLTTGRTTVVRHPAWALSSQGDWEGDAGDLGSFGSVDGRALRWFGATPCPAGPITWHRR